MDQAQVVVNQIHVVRSPETYIVYSSAAQNNKKGPNSKKASDPKKATTPKLITIAHIKLQTSQEASPSSNSTPAKRRTNQKEDDVNQRRTQKKEALPNSSKGKEVAQHMNQRASEGNDQQQLVSHLTTCSGDICEGCEVDREVGGSE